MSKLSNWLFAAAIGFSLAACGGSDNKQAAQDGNLISVIEGKLAFPAATDVVFGRLDTDKQLVLDTLKTGADSTFKYELKVTKGDPEIIDMFVSDNTVASFILDAGDELSVNVGADYNAEVQGSDESLKLMNLNKEHAALENLFAELASQLESASESQSKAISRQMAQEYSRYNIASRKYVMENSKSLTVIPVLFRQIGDLPIFSQPTDALLFASIADSLQMAYPDSRYVDILMSEVELRFNQFELEKRLQTAEEIGYLDIELPGLDGQTKKLSDLDSKVIMLYFWTVTSPEQNIFNTNTLKDIYEKYHSRGFDIYQVSFDSDKVLWATTVMNQKLPWTNVCDIRGAYSPYASMYNLPGLPAIFLIHNGELIDGEYVDEASFRRLLDRLL